MLLQHTFFPSEIHPNCVPNVTKSDPCPPRDSWGTLLCTLTSPELYAPRLEFALDWFKRLS